jgi:hypothetical protein
MNMATLPGASAREDGTSGAWYYILNRDAAAGLVRRLLDSTAVFDPDGVFDHSAKSAFHRIYTAPADSVSIHEYTAQGALDGHVAVKGIG